jgi:hypothetical protein
MSDGIGGNAHDGLVDYYTEYAPKRFRKGNGEPVGKRQQQLNILRFDLPVIYAGKGAPLIDPIEGDNRLRERARGSNLAPHRGRGRPRKV